MAHTTTTTTTTTHHGFSVGELPRGYKAMFLKIRDGACKRTNTEELELGGREGGVGF